MRFLFAVMVCVVGFVMPALAGNIVVSRAIVVAPPNAKAPTVAAYFTIENHGAVSEQFIGISTPTASGAMLHENVDDNGVMKMKMLERLEIPASGKVEMKPAQLHVMLMAPKMPYKVGDGVAFEMVFAGAGKLQVVAKVVPLSEALSP